VQQKYQSTANIANIKSCQSWKYVSHLVRLICCSGGGVERWQLATGSQCRVAKAKLILWHVTYSAPPAASPFDAPFLPPPLFWAARNAEIYCPPRRMRNASLAEAKMLPGSVFVNLLQCTLYSGLSVWRKSLLTAT